MVVPAKIRIGESITLARVKNWWAKDRKYYRHSCNADQVEHVFVNMENKAVEMFRRGELDIMNVLSPVRTVSELLGQTVEKSGYPPRAGAFREHGPGD